MDAFYASVEQRDNPEYKGKPLVVGGSPDRRGVVAAASYEARKFGIYSAMPSRTAVQRCPHLIFAKPRFDVYRQVSDTVREIFYSYTDLVEPLALDEAYLDVTHNKRGLPSATLIAREIKERIFFETNLTASAGISINKFLAKTASGINKPDGLCLIPPDKAESFLETLTIEKFYGIGQATAKKMHEAGVFSGADLKTWSEIDLVRKFGKTGSFYYRIVRGLDDRVVEPNRIRKSLASEESYADDLSDRDQMLTALQEICDTLLKRVQESGTSGRTLTLKSNMPTISRSRAARLSWTRFTTAIPSSIQRCHCSMALKPYKNMFACSVWDFPISIAKRKSQSTSSSRSISTKGVCLHVVHNG